MRVLIALAVGVVFAAMLLIDSAALVRVTVFCVTGGCGVRPMWIAVGTGAVVLAVLLTLRRPRPRQRGSRKVPPRRSHKPAGAGRRSSRVKSRPIATSPRKPLAD